MYTISFAVSTISLLVAVSFFDDHLESHCGNPFCLCVYNLFPPLSLVVAWNKALGTTRAIISWHIEIYKESGHVFSIGQWSMGHDRELISLCLRVAPRSSEVRCKRARNLSSRIYAAEGMSFPPPSLLKSKHALSKHAGKSTFSHFLPILGQREPKALDKKKSNPLARLPTAKRGIKENNKQTLISSFNLFISAMILAGWKPLLAAYQGVMAFLRSVNLTGAAVCGGLGSDREPVPLIGRRSCSHINTKVRQGAVRAWVRSNISIAQQHRPSHRIYINSLMSS